MGTIDFGGRFIIKGKIPEGYTLIEEEKQDQVFINAMLKNENDPTEQTEQEKPASLPRRPPGQLVRPFPGHPERREQEDL